MAHYNQEWEDLGRNVQDIIDRAINSHDYQRLDQTIRQVVERAVDLGSEAVRRAVDTSARTTAQTEYTCPSVAAKRELPVLYGGTGGCMAAGILKTVGGGMLSFFTFMLFLSGAALYMLVADAGMVPMGLGLAGFGAGAWLLSSGVRTLNRLKRFKAYRRTLGHKTYCTLERLARSVGKNVSFVRKELWTMISDGWFLEGHMDKEESCLITSHETYRQFEQSRLQLEERQRQAQAETKKTTAQAAPSRNPQLQEVLDRGNAFIAEIRRCNDAIPGEEISGKIDRMEHIVRRIFQRAEAHPEIVPDLKRMMDHYLPMTVKLLNAYADMDAQPIQGETIQASKREIEATLDTLNLAFEKILDDLFRDTAMDVSSDISVLNTLLAQEGLKEDELTKLRKQQNV